MIDQDLQTAYFILSDFCSSYTTAAAFCIFRITFPVRQEGKGKDRGTGIIQNLHSFINNNRKIFIAGNVCEHFKSSLCQKMIRRNDDSILAQGS